MKHISYRFPQTWPRNVSSCWKEQKCFSLQQAVVNEMQTSVLYEIEKDMDRTCVKSNAKLQKIIRSNTERVRACRISSKNSKECFFFVANFTLFIRLTYSTSGNEVSFINKRFSKTGISIFICRYFLFRVLGLDGSSRFRKRFYRYVLILHWLWCF